MNTTTKPAHRTKPPSAKQKKNAPPIVIINFKTYPLATGEQAVRLARLCQRVARNYFVDLRLAVQATDIAKVAREVTLPIYAQHVDPFKQGSHTGWITPESVKAAGARGTLLNHSEHRLGIDVLEETIHRAKEAGLFVVACANSPDVAAAIDALNPDCIALEPPELIGGEVSVSQAKPEIITEAVHKVINHTNCEQLLVGAGVKSAEDVTTALSLGAQGVLIASHIANNPDPGRVLEELLEPYKK
ncbi:triose-phosphate isomerase [Candidatus Woesearchaeota archaeon]|nr:MAG: triose-phosphate isomerase [Candidatus Woesearchaeota archaeon]